jgi:hypothetical protein
VLAADVAGVKNHIDALQRGDRLGANQAVRVGNDADFGPAIPRYSPSSPRSNLCIGP